MGNSKKPVAKKDTKKAVSSKDKSIIKGARCVDEKYEKLKLISQTVRPRVSINALIEYGIDMVIDEYKEKGIIK